MEPRTLEGINLSRYIDVDVDVVVDIDVIILIIFALFHWDRICHIFCWKSPILLGSKSPWTYGSFLRKVFGAPPKSHPMPSLVILAWLFCIGTTPWNILKQHEPSEKPTGAEKGHPWHSMTFFLKPPWLVMGIRCGSPVSSIQSLSIRKSLAVWNNGKKLDLRKGTRPWSKKESF